MAKQQTIAGKITLEGIGLHTRKNAVVHLMPSDADTGIIFSTNGIDIAVNSENVANTHFYTSLSADGHEVKQVEHLLAALRLCGVDNARIEIDGIEMPILDGSAYPHVVAVQRVGLTSQNVERKNMMLVNPLHITLGDSYIAYTPAADLQIAGTIDYPNTLIGRQTFTYQQGMPIEEIARARTFCMYEDIDSLKERGLGLGGSLDNTIVIKDAQILNEGGLRFPDEFARHKVLDLIGDLQLAGGHVVGHIEAFRSGHTINHAFVEAFITQMKSEQRSDTGLNKLLSRANVRQP